MKMQRLAEIFSNLSYAALGAAGIAVYYFGHQPTQDTLRISRTAFLEANPELNGGHLSAFGELYKDGRFKCSIELLEPGNLLTTANHCIDRNDPDARYQFVTLDTQGTRQAIELNLHGENEWGNVHIPPGTTINETEADIAFIPLYITIPDTVIPAPIAGPQLTEVMEVTAIGYSRNAREIDPGEHDKLSLSKQACHALPKPGQESIITSSCYVSHGDSGGSHAVWKDDIPAALSVHSSSNWLNTVFNHVTRALENSGIYTEFNGSADSTLIYPYHEFCYENIGAEFCSGFPELSPAPSG